MIDFRAVWIRFCVESQDRGAGTRAQEADFHAGRGKIGLNPWKQISPVRVAPYENRLPGRRWRAIRAKLSEVVSRGKEAIPEIVEDDFTFLCRRNKQHFLLQR